MNMNQILNLSRNEALQGVNWNDIKRTMPIVGATLILLGLVRRSPLNVLLAAVGGSMVYEGFKNGNWSNVPYEKGLPTQQTLAHGQGIRVEQQVTIARSRADLYRFWRKLENLPRVMQHLESVRTLSPTRSHWVAKAPAGMTVAWDAEIINDVENELVGWRSLEGADVPNAGSVRFTMAPGSSNTIVQVNLKYDVPMGPLGAAVAKLFGTDPGQTVRQDLVRFRAMMEQQEPALA